MHLTTPNRKIDCVFGDSIPESAICAIKSPIKRDRNDKGDGGFNPSSFTRKDV